MKNFVRRGDRVVILPNAEWRYRGRGVNPAIAVEVVHLFAEAGAAPILITTNYGAGRWGENVAKEPLAAGARMKSPTHPKEYMAARVSGG